ncbi:MAG: AAA family ATPase [Planctomycetota bacterium]
MSVIIALSGKGGVGKTTLAALLVRCAVEQRRGPVLAVDADPNASLGILLGAEPERTIADIREEALEKSGASDTSRPRQLEYAIQCLALEREGYDLVTMGRPEGPRCYCYVNNLLRSYMDSMARTYPLVVIDNEAGMEHLSRRTTNDVDHLWIVTAPTALGLRTAGRISQIARELPIRVGRMGLILNRSVPGTRERPSAAAVEGAGIEVLGEIPEDEAVAEASVRGEPVFALGSESAALQAISDILARTLEKR